MKGPLLEVSGVTKRFGGLDAIKDVSFTVSPGEIVGLIGPNGAGKTTMFNLIHGLDTPNAGTIRFDGEDLTRLRASDRLHRGIARTFQSVSILFRQSPVYTNVLRACHARMGRGLRQMLTGRASEAAHARAAQLVELVGLTEFRSARTADLPYGYQRLVGVAMALAGQPRLLMLDEPAAGLLPHETDFLVQIIRQVRSDGVTVLIVEHDVKTIMNICDQVVVLNFGAKIADGTPSEVRTNQDVIAAYLGTQAVHAG